MVVLQGSSSNLRRWFACVFIALVMGYYFGQSTNTQQVLVCKVLECKDTLVQTREGRGGEGRGAEFISTPPPSPPDTLGQTREDTLGQTLTADTWKAFSNAKVTKVDVFGQSLELIHISETWLQVVVEEFSSDQYALRKYVKAVEAGSIPSPKIIVDIGANIGFFSLFMAKTFPNATIFAFEPVQLNFGHLNWNLGHNNVRNVVAQNIGFSNKKGVARIQSIHSWNQGGSTMANQKENWGFDTFYVFGDTLEGLIKASGLDHDAQTIDFLKLDCEGCEYQAFAINKENGEFVDPVVTKLLKRVRFFAGETHPKNKEQFNRIELEKAVMKANPGITFTVVGI